MADQFGWLQRRALIEKLDLFDARHKNLRYSNSYTDAVHELTEEIDPPKQLRTLDAALTETLEALRFAHPHAAQGVPRPAECDICALLARLTAPEQPS